jgi:hypothetical protein
MEYWKRGKVAHAKPWRGPKAATKFAEKRTPAEALRRREYKTSASQRLCGRTPTKNRRTKNIHASMYDLYRTALRRRGVRVGQLRDRADRANERI